MTTIEHAAKMNASGPTMDILFDPEPKRWGLRGDPFLWRAMRNSLAGKPLPFQASEFVRHVERSFTALAGRPLLPGEAFHVEAFSRGGMSSGHVDPWFWIAKALPLLLSRYAKLNAVRSASATHYTEKQLDLIFERSLATDADFAAWLLSKTRFGGQGFRYHWSRANWAWARTEIEMIDPNTGEPKIMIRDGETDILVVFENIDGVRVALHIENKLANGRFVPLQPESYTARSKMWAGHKKYHEYSDWQTVVIAPSFFLERNAMEARKFDVQVTYEAISEFLPAFKVE